jgi:hypothetical protein
VRCRAQRSASPPGWRRSPGVPRAGFRSRLQRRDRHRSTLSNDGRAASLSGLAVPSRRRKGDVAAARFAFQCPGGRWHSSVTHPVTPVGVCRKPKVSRRQIVAMEEEPLDGARRSNTTAPSPSCRARSSSRPGSGHSSSLIQESMPSSHPGVGGESRSLASTRATLRRTRRA